MRPGVVVRAENPVGSLRLHPSASTGVMFDTASRGGKETNRRRTSIYSQALTGDRSDIEFVCWIEMANESMKDGSTIAVAVLRSSLAGC